MTTPATPGGRVPMERLTLEFPRSLAVYDDYLGAQKAVDYLSDHEFAVENVLIVGTDLKQVERVIGRLTWTKVLTGGILTGMWLGLFVGLIMSMFSSTASGSAGTIISTVLTGAVFGAVWGGIGYAFTRGKRDFTSVSSVVATKYEVLVEHRVFDQARSLLVEGGLTTGLAAAGSAGSSSAPSRPNPYEGRYGVRRDDPSAPSASAASASAPSASASSDSAPSDSAPAAEPGTSYTSPTGEPRYGQRLPEGPPAGERRGDGGPDAPPQPRD